MDINQDPKSRKKPSMREFPGSHGLGRHCCIKGYEGLTIMDSWKGFLETVAPRSIYVPFSSVEILLKPHFIIYSFVAVKSQLSIDNSMGQSDHMCAPFIRPFLCACWSMQATLMLDIFLILSNEIQCPYCSPYPYIFSADLESELVLQRVAGNNSCERDMLWELSW